MESASSPASPATPEAPLTVPDGPEPLPVAQLVMAVALAWLVPGLGHVYLKRVARGLIFFVLVLAAVLIGCSLQGNLYHPVQGQPLTYLATLGSLGMGAPYFAVR